MTDIQFDAERCKGCGLCALFCPCGNVKMSETLNRHGQPYAELIDQGRCTGCGLCYRMCPDTAIRIERTKKTIKSQ